MARPASERASIAVRMRAPSRRPLLQPAQVAEAVAAGARDDGAVDRALAGAADGAAVCSQPHAVRSGGRTVGQQHPDGACAGLHLGAAHGHRVAVVGPGPHAVAGPQAGVLADRGRGRLRVRLWGGLSRHGASAHGGLRPLAAARDPALHRVPGVVQRARQHGRGLAALLGHGVQVWVRARDPALPGRGELVRIDRRLQPQQPQRTGAVGRPRCSSSHASQGSSRTSTSSSRMGMPCAPTSGICGFMRRDSSTAPGRSSDSAKPRRW